VGAAKIGLVAVVMGGIHGGENRKFLDVAGAEENVLVEIV